ncbi:MAG: biosynthetic arginine decarboxylase [Myxococcales bacterium]|nr:biosynthetic arginine decarboxylase [Myxococcales bacterium]
MSHWDIESARRLYNVRQWSEGFFDVDVQGRVCALPTAHKHSRVPLAEVVEESQRMGLKLPILMRFADILGERVSTLTAAFSKMMKNVNYQGRYTCVYPVKVNQRATVVNELVQRGGDQIGLEAGSKPELIAILALAARPGCTIICNGYKDREYVRLALLGRAMGLNVYLVIEKAAEFQLVVEESKLLGIEPLLGVRLRLSSLGVGKWQSTGGEKAKFGLSARQLLELTNDARRAGMLSSLRLLHFHMGSQISNVRNIQQGISEAARYYVELRQQGVPIDTMDVGGGLAVDYEGCRGRSFFSMNYGAEQYAENIVEALERVCTEHDLPHPNIITESGRALTAHHAVLVTHVTELETAPEWMGDPPPKDAHYVVQTMHVLAEEDDERPPIEAYYEAQHFLSEGRSLFGHGMLSLEERAWLDELFFAVCRKVYRSLEPKNRGHRELLDELGDILADKYFCNFSVFRSTPDIWAIEQVFPIVPLERLNEPPVRRARLEDLTCDSDGRIDHYIEQDGITTTLPVHLPLPGRDYLLGIFLVGAYQETLGDIHNLFGSTDAANIELYEGGWRISSVTKGDTTDKLLREVGYETTKLREALYKKLERSELPPDILAIAMEAMDEGLTSYTYLED